MSDAPVHPIDPGLVIAHQSLVMTLRGLQEFADLVVPWVKEMDLTRLVGPPVRFSEAMKRLSEDEKREVLRQIREVGEGVLEVVGRKIDGEQSEPPETLSVSTGPIANDLLMHMARSVLTPRHETLVLRSLVPVAVGAFEVFIGEMVAAALRAFPGILASDDKEFSLKELQSLGTVEEAISALVERRVDRLLVGGLSDWVDWFGGSPLKIEMQQLVPSWADVEELFQRRHIIVHNGGRVSKRYRSQLESLLDELPPIGTELVVDVGYAGKAVDLLYVLGVLTWAFTARRVGTGAATAGYLFGDLDDLIDRERWWAAWAVAGMAETFRDFDEMQLVQFKLLRLYCQKKLDGLDSVREELLAMDVSALNLRLRAQYLVLLERQAELTDVVCAALAAKEISEHELAVFPVLRDVDFNRESDLGGNPAG